MTITVIGHLCIDEHHSAEGKETQEMFGGIMYSLTTLANLMSGSDTIYPIFPVGQDEYDKTMKFLRQYPNINTEGIYRIDSPTNRVILFYYEGGQGRTECSKHISPAIPWERIKPFLNTNALLINMVSGFDVTLETLDRIRMEVREKQTPIHFDFHSLTLGIDGQAKRYRRPLQDWRRWCFFVNSIQMSEEEANGLTTEHYDEPTLINQLMPLMVQSLLITRGARGATFVHQNNKKLTRHDIAGITATGTIDPTGCGDVYGAAFLFHVVKSHDALQAARFANTVAAFNASGKGPEALNTFKEHSATEIPV
ncbi:MAG: carbohydrate kinase family protein [Ignavibacteriae bacterium]|nr:carbohydrate kinase family protein [Ignavibacteriota bacterium]